MCSVALKTKVSLLDSDRWISQSSQQILIVLYVLDKAREIWFIGLEEKRLKYQEGLVKLERTRKLSKQLMDTVEPLQEDWTALVHVLGCRALTAAVCKLVSKLKPFFLHQHAEPLHTRHQHSKCCFSSHTVTLPTKTTFTNDENRMEKN